MHVYIHMCIHIIYAFFSLFQLEKISKDIVSSLQEKIEENKALNDCLVNQQGIVSELQGELNQQNILLEEKDTQLADLELEKDKYISQVR